MSEGLSMAVLSMKMRGVRAFNPKTSKSTKWINWVTKLSSGTCRYCKNQNGKIFDVKSPPNNIPVHPNCRCTLERVLSIVAGTATIDGGKGADLCMYLYNRLPENYITKDDAEERGWVSIKGILREKVPGATIGGDEYSNDGGELPKCLGRKWYEADINYTGGYRGKHRILYSNDGLIFVTYDHYNTFYEII